MGKRGKPMVTELDSRQEGGEGAQGRGAWTTGSEEQQARGLGTRGDGTTTADA
jgi:hypothetical protein